MLKRDRKEIQKQVEFLVKLDMARLSRAAGLVGKVLDNVTEVDTDHIAVPIKLYCSKYEIQSVKNILEHILDEYKKQIVERQLA